MWCQLQVLLRVQQTIVLRQQTIVANRVSSQRVMVPSNCLIKPCFCERPLPSSISKEQVTLWGGLFGILLTIASIVYCRKNDVNIPACVAFKHCLIRCCCGHDVPPDSPMDKQAEMSLTTSPAGRKPEASKSNGSHHGWRTNVVQPMVTDQPQHSMTNV